MTATLPNAWLQDTREAKIGHQSYILHKDINKCYEMLVKTNRQQNFF